MKGEERTKPISVLDLIERTQNEKKTAEAAARTSFDWLPVDASRRRELRKKISDEGRKSLTQAERKEAKAHGLIC